MFASSAKSLVTVAALLVAGVSRALANEDPSGRDTPASLADAAYAAMGLNASGEQGQLKTLVTRATLKQWDPGGTGSIADPLRPDIGTATFTNTWDRAHDSWRTEWRRPRPVGPMRTYTEIYTPAGGYVTGIDAMGAPPKRTIRDEKGQPAHTMSGVRLRALLREQDRNQIVIAMHEHPERLSPLPHQTAGGKVYPAVRYQDDNGAFIVMFDPATHLPAVVRTRDFDGHMGDADYDAAYSDWRGVGDGGRLKQPFHVVYTLNGVNIFDERVDEVSVNGSLPPDTFMPPANLQGQAPQAAAAERTPFQWVIRRLASGFYLDSDALYMDDGAALTLTDVGPNISLATGGSHNTLIVATDNALVAFDAPGDDVLSNRVIEAAKRRYPGKPFRYVMLTHHHEDHTGGVRAYAAEGATVVVGKGDGDYFKKVLTAPQALNPYRLKPIRPRVIEVDGKWSQSIGGRTIEAYSLDTAHSAGYLIFYVPDAKMAFQTDLWGGRVPPALPSDPTVAAFTTVPAMAIVDGVKKIGITPERIAGGHGVVGDYADLVKFVERVKATDAQTRGPQ